MTHSRQSPPATGRPAVFFDRDGTLIDDVGTLRDPACIVLYPDTVDALLSLRDDYLFFVVTNQSAVADGDLTLNEVDKVHDALARMLANHGIVIEEWYVCPHNKGDGCSCRKPSAHFLLEAAKAHDIDLTTSFIVGDHPHDAVTGREHGVRGLYLLTGHGRKHAHELGDDIPVFESIRGAAAWIHEHAAGEKGDA